VRNNMDPDRLLLNDARLISTPLTGFAERYRLIEG